MSAQNFNSVLLEISNQLDSEHVTKLKFLVRDVIGKRELEKISTGYRLFEVLTERRKLGPNDTDFLSGLLQDVHRPDLADRLTSFGTRGGPTDLVLDETERAKLEIASEVIAENLGRNWRKLGRKLRISDVKLESISRRHPTELEEVAVELLKEWKKSRGAEAQTDELIRALRDCQLNLTADKLEDKLKDRGYQ